MCISYIKYHLQYQLVPRKYIVNDQKYMKNLLFRKVIYI